MQLTGKEIIEKGIIVGYCEKGIQQQGIDVRLDKVFKLVDTVGRIWKNSTDIPDRYEIQPKEDNMFYLTPGYYEIELMESCEMKDKYCMYFKTRSSLVRCGTIVHSGQFDAGFKTDKMGCFLHVIRTIKIEKGARIAQAIVNETHIVSSLYDGQFQNDKQRK